MNQTIEQRIQEVLAQETNAISLSQLLFSP